VLVSEDTLAERIYLSVPDMGGAELGYIQDAFASNWLSTVGPHIDAFEREIEAHLGGDVHAIAVSSGTAAMHLVLRAAGVGSGDVVAVSTLTFAGSVFPILYVGAEPVFIDSEEASWNMDPNVVEDYFRDAARTGRMPKALIVVHLYGQHADLDSLIDICDRYGVTLIEDAAESLGGTYRGRQTGTSAPFSILSFNGNKIITTSGGGMALTKDAGAAASIRNWANQARRPAVEYVHEELGYNYRMSNVLAAIGRGQIQVLEQRVRQRREVAARYAAGLAGIDDVTLQSEAAWGTHSRWLSVITLPSAVAPGTVVASLTERNIEVRPAWRPMHTQPLFRGARAVGGSAAERLFAHGLCLPSSSSLSIGQQQRVMDALTTMLTAVPGPA
jgi:pyridoxal phosphate-dependent aminotransferase EpsN